MDSLEAILSRELARTEPDYVVYQPKSLDGLTFDTGNEHFLVFRDTVRQAIADRLRPVTTPRTTTPTGGYP